MSIQSTLNDPDIIQNLQEKIHKRKQKRVSINGLRLIISERTYPPANPMTY